MAGLRLGLAFASEQIIDLMNRVKPPYNVSGIAQRAVLDAINATGSADGWVDETLRERDRLIRAFEELPFVEKIYPTDANFVLVRTSDPKGIYKYLVDERIIVRDRSNVELCEGCLRITVGTPDENTRLLNALSRFKKLNADS